MEPLKCEVCKEPVGQKGGEPVRKLARDRYAHPSCLRAREQAVRPRIHLPDRRLWRPR